MGCDIHVFTEVSQSVDSVNQWINVDHWKLNKHFTDGLDGEKQYTCVPIYRDRNYSLFAALAGVRDYSSGNPRVADPKGLPDDISKAAAAEAERWDSDGHTHSWLTLKELIDWQATQSSVKYSGLVSAEQAKALDENGVTPQSWCQGTNQPGYVPRAWSEPCKILEPLIEALEERAREEFWIWDKKAPIPADKQELIRIVFWFDN